MHQCAASLASCSCICVWCWVIECLCVVLINVVPLELLELVLMRTFIKMFSEHLKSHYKTREAIIAAAYSSLSAVCYNWWQTMNGWPQSNTGHSLRHYLRLRLHRFIQCKLYSDCVAYCCYWLYCFINPSDITSLLSNSIFRFRDVEQQLICAIDWDLCVKLQLNYCLIIINWFCSYWEPLRLDWEINTYWTNPAGP